MMDSVLSLQLLSTTEPVDTSCSNSSVSCPSKASCYSHNSGAATLADSSSSW